MADQINLETILNGSVGEGQRLDFKRQIDLDQSDKKMSIIDDVVAFLNADGGQILIGLDEDRKTSTARLAPLTGNSDKLCMRIQDIVTSNIAPPPARVTASEVIVEGGFLVCIDIGQGHDKPYCNRLNGRYLQRRGRKNEPLLPGEVSALRNTRERMTEGVVSKANAYIEQLRRAEYFKLACPRLHLSILPREHLDSTFPEFVNQQGVRGKKGFPAVHGTYHAFERGSAGYDVSAIDMNGNKISRFFVGEDWALHSTVCHPIPLDEGQGRIDFGKMQAEFHGHMNDIQEFLATEALTGPFSVFGMILDLHSREHFTHFFPRGDSISFGRPMFLEAFEADKMATLLVERIRQSSVYG